MASKISSLTAASAFASTDEVERNTAGGSPSRRLSMSQLFGDQFAAVGQLKFPGTQSSASNVNTLDDYEEGTFTPTVAFGSGTTGITYAAQVGRYTKVGNRVIFNLYVELTSNGSSTGAFDIRGLPFTSQNTTNAFAGCALACNNLTGITGQVMAYISPNATQFSTLLYLGTGTSANLDDTKVTDTAWFTISGAYETAT